MNTAQSDSIGRAGELLEMAVDNPGVDPKVLASWLRTAAERITTVADQLSEKVDLKDRR